MRTKANEGARRGFGLRQCLGLPAFKLVCTKRRNQKLTRSRAEMKGRGSPPPVAGSLLPSPCPQASLGLWTPSGATCPSECFWSRVTTDPADPSREGYQYPRWALTGKEQSHLRAAASLGLGVGPSCRAPTHPRCQGVHVAKSLSGCCQAG